jgi:pyruvate dehydrogenase E2 component (dihydrolipoamide acetyltransferase)
MVAEFRMPALGADMDAGTVIEWRIAPGSRVKRGDVVAVVETDKGAIDVEIFMDGVVREIVVAQGTRVPVGTVLALVDTEEPAAASAGAPVPDGGLQRQPKTGAAPSSDRLKVSPAARRRARELDVDVARLRGTGPDGAITLDDVERARPAAPASRAAPEAAPAPAEEPAGGGMRAAIAAAMSRSKREIPHYYLATTVDVTGTVEWLATRNASVPVTQRVLFAALIVKAVALTCREMKGFSGFHRDGCYEEGDPAHVGVAVALRSGGLVAPAIMDTAAKPLAVLMDEFRDLVARARAGRLRASELSAPTIILTSLGDAPVDTVFPIIQPPQVAIVGAGAIAERPWVVAGQVVPRQVLGLSLGADHRVTDGRLGARFLARIGERLLDPASL